MTVKEILDEVERLGPSLRSHDLLLQAVAVLSKENASLLKKRGAK